MTVEADGIQSEVEAAVLTALATAGPRGIDKAAVLRPFVARGEAARSTIYLWAARAIDRAKAAAEEAANPAPKSAPKSKVAPAVAADDGGVAELAALVPAMATMEATVAGSGGQGTIQVTAMLRAVVDNVNMLMAHAKGPDGKVRNARLLLQSTDALRRCLETSVRVFQAMRDVEQVDRLHAAIIEEAMKESPEAAERMLRRMDAIADAWGG